MGKGEIARHEQFLLFPQCFQKACFAGAPKGVIVWEWVNVQSILPSGLCARFFPILWLLFQITIVKTFISIDRGINLVTITVNNPGKEAADLSWQPSLACRQFLYHINPTFNVHWKDVF